MSPADERLWGTLTHVGGLVGNFFGIGWIVSLVAYLVLKDRGPFVRSHTATELNFQLTLLIAYVATFIVAFITFGFGAILVFVPMVVGIIFGIIAAITANKGEYYTYPVAIKFVS